MSRKYDVTNIQWNPDDLDFDVGDIDLYRDEYPDSIEVEIDDYSYDEESAIRDYLRDEFDAEAISFDYELVEDEEYGDESEHVNEYGEPISVYDAAEIWLSNGKDEDYMFGYTEEELEDALN